MSTETKAELRRRIKANVLEAASRMVACDIAPDPEWDVALADAVIEEVSDELDRRSRRLWQRVKQDAEVVGGLVPPTDEEMASHGG